MGEQKSMPVQLIADGDALVVHHDWGHRMDATLGSVSSKGVHAMISFGIAGERKVRLTETPSGKPAIGRFYGPRMEPWFLDTATVERLIATAKAAAEKEAEV